MNDAYKKTLIVADILAILFGGAWIIYTIKRMTFGDLYANIGVHSLLIYVAVGNLAYQFIEKK